MGGAWSVPAYTMKGLYQEMLKNQGSGVQNYIIAARISQGYDEAAALSPADKADVVSQWRRIKTNVKKKKNPGEDQMQALHSYMSERREKKEKKDRFGQLKKQTTAPGLQDSHATRAGTGTSLEPLHHAQTYPDAVPSHSAPAHPQADLLHDEEAERAQLEFAIRASVSETSRGNPEEDELIARAIRASMLELQREPAPNETEEHALQRAMNASMEEAQKSGVSAEEQQVLEETLRASMLDTSRAKRGHSTDSEWDSSDTEDDEAYQRILAESEKLHQLHSSGDKHDEYFSSIAGAREAGGAQAQGDEEEEEALRKAIEESERLDKEGKEKLEKQMTEEEIVMEYVKKQSLAEAQHRERMRAGRDEGQSSAGGR